MRTLLITTAAFAALLQPLSASAQQITLPNTCGGWKARCERLCTPDAISRGAPVGCTCQERCRQCQASGMWHSWRLGAPGHWVADRK
jgi:hypothetical protein